MRFTDEEVNALMVPLPETYSYHMITVKYRLGLVYNSDGHLSLQSDALYVYFKTVSYPFI